MNNTNVNRKGTQGIKHNYRMKWRAKCRIEKGYTRTTRTIGRIEEKNNITE